MIIADISRSNDNVRAMFRIVLVLIFDIGDSIIGLLIVVITPKMDIVITSDFLIRGEIDIATATRRN